MTKEKDKIIEEQQALLTELFDHFNKESLNFAKRIFALENKIKDLSSKKTKEEDKEEYPDMDITNIDRKLKKLDF